MPKRTSWLSPGRLLLFAAATASAALALYALRPRPAEVELARASLGRMTVTVDEDGRTRVRERYVVSAPLAGRLLRVELHPGDEVRAGKTLVAAIEPRVPDLLDVRAEAEAQARLQAAEAAVRRATPEVARCQAELEFAEAEGRRVRQMYERDAASQKEFEQAALIERVRRQQLKGAEFALEIAGFELAQARAALLRTRPPADGAPAAGRFEIPSPCDGFVLRVLQESSAVVAPGTPLLEVGDPADTEVVIDVLSSDGARIPRGAAVTLSHWAGDAAPLRAVVRLVEPSAFLKVSALGVEEQRVNVIADLVDPPDRRPSLGDGFRVDASIVVWEAEDVLRVPTSALFRRDDGWYAFAAVRGRAYARRLRLGHLNASHAEVLDGLSAGDEVIVHPDEKIADGVAILPRGGRAAP